MSVTKSTLFGSGIKGILLLTFNVSKYSLLVGILHELIICVLCEGLL